jgi:hypothetical protein
MKQPRQSRSGGTVIAGGIVTKGKRTFIARLDIGFFLPTAVACEAPKKQIELVRMQRVQQIVQKHLRSAAGPSFLAHGTDVADLSVTWLTSNPTIFDHAFKNSST